MLLTPATARAWLPATTRDRSWPGHGAMMIRRREALAALQPAYASWSRLALGALAWALGVGGAVLVGRHVAAEDGTVPLLGIAVLLVGAVLGGLVVAAGSVLARATAAWWTLPTAVSADGGPADPAAPSPQTLRAHEDVVAEDRSAGSAELWRSPLLPRTVAVLLLVAATVVLVVRAVLGFGEVSTPYAGGAERGPWLTQVLAAVVCALAAGFTAAGLRRVHRARMHRVRHAGPSGTQTSAAPLTPAVGTGAIVVGGTYPGAGAPPAGPPAPTPAPTSAAAPPPAPAPPAPAAAPAPAPASTASPAPPPAPAPTPAAAPAPAAAPPAVKPPAGPSRRVRLADGREVRPGTTLLGRSPQPRPGEEVDALLPVADERVSKTHLTVRVADGSVVVLDRGSTNGTTLHRTDGTSRALPPGEPVELADGDVVVLGGTTLAVGEGDDVEHTVLRSPQPDAR